MIDLTRLYCGEINTSEQIRYDWRSQDKDLLQVALKRKPVVVWNLTRTCNLKCLHCYADSEAKMYPGELTTGEALKVIDDLSEFKIAALLLSGGEPLLRRDIFELAHHANAKDLRTTLSTNGTLITLEMAQKIKQTGFTYVGISLDGIGPSHDHFRGVPGAFNKTLQGIRNLKEVGQKVGLRLTMTRHTIKSLSSIFDLMIKENIDRACFYHLVFTGRGRFLKEDALSNTEVREAVQLILDWTKSLTASGHHKEILTVGNPVDGVHIYLKLLEEKQEAKAANTLDLLNRNGGGLFGSGVGLGCIDFFGNVHPDQFWMDESLGNVKERPFSQIWQDLGNPLMKGLKNRIPNLNQRCKTCQWIQQCGGGLRTRAHLAYNDPWAEDPGCYLS